tara:strand:- start:532 stop:1341 length:810 start_codon:yes stop_codon:yes gene_type:complete
MTYDFLGSAYFKTSSEELNYALNSIHKQILKPKKVVLVFDGPVKYDLFEIVNSFKVYLKIDLLELDENYGLGIALREGLKLCDSKYVLRFDTDDYNLPSRAEKQISFMIKGNYDISGSYVSEFLNNVDNIISIKKVPTSEEKIKNMIPFRNPFNHPSICFKLDSILKLDGGYRHFPFYEDYDLWIRAIHSGLRCSNLDEYLVAMKSNQIISRRIGLNMVFNEMRLFKTFWKYSFKDFIFFLPSFLLRSSIRLLPSRLVVVFYKKFLRAK